MEPVLEATRINERLINPGLFRIRITSSFNYIREVAIINRGENRKKTVVGRVSLLICADLTPVDATYVSAK